MIFEEQAFLCTYSNICFGDSVTHVAIFKKDINIRLIFESIIHFPEMKLYTSFAVLAGLLAFSQACFVAVWTPNPAPAPSPPAPSPPAPSPPAPSPLVRSSNQGAYLNLLVQFKSWVKDSFTICLLFSDIAYLEWMSFDVCDKDGDGGLTWQDDIQGGDGGYT